MKVVGILVIILNIASTYAFKLSPNKTFQLTNKSEAFHLDPQVDRGQPAEDGLFPFMLCVLMTWSAFENTRCSASLISPKWVLSAAHCVYLPFDDLETLVFVGGKSDIWEFVKTNWLEGKTTVDAKSLGVQERECETIFVHPLFNPIIINNDIALIRLKRPFTLSSIKTIPLSKEKMVRQMSCIVVGFGKTDKNANNFILHYVKDKKVSTTELGCLHRSSGRFLCMNAQESGALEGDSGGPLVCDGKVWGIASHIYPSKPTNETPENYFTELYYYLDWVNECMNRGNPSVVINLKSMLVLSGLWLFLKSWVDIY